MNFSEAEPLESQFPNYTFLRLRGVLERAVDGTFGNGYAVGTIETQRAVGADECLIVVVFICWGEVLVLDFGFRILNLKEIV